jgi:hypothetical protein
MVKYSAYTCKYIYIHIKKKKTINQYQYQSKSQTLAARVSKVRFSSPGHHGKGQPHHVLAIHGTTWMAWLVFFYDPLAWTAFNVYLYNIHIYIYISQQDIYIYIYICIYNIICQSFPLYLYNVDTNWYKYSRSQTLFLRTWLMVALSHRGKVSPFLFHQKRDRKRWWKRDKWKWV